MAESLELEIVTPDRAVFAASALSVVVPGTDGEMEVLPDHLPLLTTIHAGSLIVSTVNGDTRKFFIDGGFAEIQPNRVVILTGQCDGTDEVDVERAKILVEEAEKQYLKLEDGKEDEISLDDREEYLAALDRARRRLAFSEEHSD